MSKQFHEQIGIVARGGTVGQTTFKSYGNNLVGVSGCVVLLVDSGCATVSVGFKRRLLRQGMMAVLFYDDTFWVERSSKAFSCRYVSLSEENVQEAIYRLTSPHFWDYLSENPLFLLAERHRKLFEEWYAQMVWICNDVASEHADAMLRNNIYNLFLAMDSEMQKGGVYEQKSISRNRVLIISFLKLLAQHFRHARDVSFYAERLCITTTYLYKLTHKRFNLSPKQIIDQQTICEIKTLLSGSNMSVKEIAHLLHFEDTPYMCRYFRRHTGLSPLEYRSGG